MIRSSGSQFAPPSRPSRQGRRSRSGRRRGFTLVELLVVITIIAILVSLVGFAAYSALEVAKVSAIAVEISQLQNAIEQYKTAHNGYPPDFTPAFPDGTVDANRNFVLRHITNGYQRLNINERTLIANSLTTGNNTFPVNPQDPTADHRFLWEIDAAEALVFWLGALYEHNQYPVTGFNGTAQRKPGYDFKPERLKDVDFDGWPEYYPSTRPDEPPYVYFHNQTYPFASYAYPPPSVGPPAKGIAIAYLSDQRDTNIPILMPFDYYQFANAQKFQIVCAGLDGKYNSRPAPPPPVDPMAYPRFPSGLNPAGGMGYDMPGGELDNLTNFSEGQLEDKIDQ